MTTSASISRLQDALDARATEKSRKFWSQYLKGNAVFRGVPMAGIRDALHTWWKAEGFHDVSPAAQKRIALRLFKEEPTEDKLAGVLALSEILILDLSVKDLPSFASLFARGLIADWNTCDWFCVKVLGKAIEHSDNPAVLSRAISAWKSSKPLWQRRASCVAFVNLAKYGHEHVPGLPDLIIDSCDALVRDPERFAQTGAGWVLRELSLFDRPRVSAFAKAHLAHLSREGIKYIVEKMPADEQKRLLTLHTKQPKGGRAGRPSKAARFPDVGESGHSSLQRPIQPMLDFVRNALDERGLMGAYLARPPDQQNDYLGWINRAKRPQTKDKRLGQMLDELKNGDSYTGMAWRTSALTGGKRR